MNNLLNAIPARKPLWVPLLVASFAAGGLVLIAWGAAIFTDTGFSW